MKIGTWLKKKVKANVEMPAPIVFREEDERRIFSGNGYTPPRLREEKA